MAKWTGNMLLLLKIILWTFLPSFDSIQYEVRQETWSKGEGNDNMSGMQQSWI